MKVTALTCLVLAFMATPHPAARATTGDAIPAGITASLTLNDAIKTALANSPAVSGPAADVDAANAATRSADAMKRPSISGTLYGTTGDSTNIVTSSPGVSPQNIMSVPQKPFGDANMTLMVPLSTGGRLNARAQSARESASAATGTATAARLAVTQAVIAAYAKALLERELVTVAQSRVTSQTEQARIVGQKVVTGALAPVDLLRVQAEVADAQGAQATAESDSGMADADLKEALGISQASQLTLTENLDTLLSDDRALPASQDDAVAQAVSARPEIEAAAASVAAARSSIKDAKGAYSPQVYGLAMADASSASGSTRAGYTIGLSASLPLYDAGQRRADVQAAEARVRRAEADALAVRLSIERQAAGAWLSLSAATARLAAARTGVEAARKGDELAAMRYTAGKSTLAERLDTQTALVRAQGALAQSKADLAIARENLRLLTSRQ
jgi:outer membrane protein TolC